LLEEKWFHIWSPLGTALDRQLGEKREKNQVTKKNTIYVSKCSLSEGVARGPWF